MARPGIMVYFDMLGPIKVLPDADKGRLFVAMLEYGQSGIWAERNPAGVRRNVGVGVGVCEAEDR